MPDLAPVTADRAEVVGLPNSSGTITAAAGEDISALAPITQNASGKWVRSGAAAAAPANTVQAIALRTVKSGESLTGLREGRIDNYNLDAQAYGARIFVSNTLGALADAAGTASLPVGFVEVATAQPIGSPHDKVLHVKIPA
jgi:hypothetical protein